MARPKTPLISRRAALETALKLVDTEGLDALSIRRLGDELNVNGASLYHHFKNKDEILIGLTQLALEDVTAPRSDTESWRSWLPANADRTRRVLVAHPELVPLMLERSNLGIGARELGASVQHMEAEGVALEAIAPLIHSLELLAILCALQEIGADKRAAMRGVDHDSPEVEAFYRAEAAGGLEAGELFDALVNATIAAVEMAVRFKTSRETTPATGDDAASTPRRTRKTDRKTVAERPSSRKGARAGKRA